MTARTREPHVRVYTEEKDRITWLLVDQRQTMFFGSRWKMKSVAAAEAAAIACWRVLAQGDRIGAVVVSDQDLDVIPPHRSQERVARILERVVHRNGALLAGAGRGLLVAEYPPAEIKKAVVGTGGATKDQVGWMVQKLLGLAEPPRPSDAADGCAAAICHILTGTGPLATRRAEAGR